MCRDVGRIANSPAISKAEHSQHSRCALLAKFFSRRNASADEKRSRWANKVSVRRNCARGADGITHKEQPTLLSNVSGDRSDDDGKTLPLMKSLFATPGTSTSHHRSGPLHRSVHRLHFLDTIHLFSFLFFSPAT
ncbi:hypothetical protein CDAR_429491 [Caerostris darwini]|uniref:Uncharacterized protein n=1 Tax=Caerostris darwini TaxID=1538125 RepID=A0AAV4WGP6_9ARAC|nr:hypothetical protein CDAR_429491 [Caerostris darwini]